MGGTVCRITCQVEVEANQIMTQTGSHITTVFTGPEALSALAQAVDQAQAGDRFARVVVITDHHDVARSVRHWLGGKGLINVTVQTGRHLADELARPTSPALPRLLESQAVRHVAEAQADRLGLDPAGRHRFYRSLSTAFRDMAERADTPVAAAASEPDDMNLLAERLYVEYRKGVSERGYHLPAELPHMAAEALNNHWTGGHEPAVIYYLPRGLSMGDTQLAKVLLERGKCQVVAGLAGDENADGQVRELLNILGNQGVEETSNGSEPSDPLCQRAEARALAIVAVPDPEEEIRTVVRYIAASDAPFHRIAVIHRQDNPYASLLRQELDFAHIPYSGVTHRSLGDTQTGLLLLGLVDLAVELNAPTGVIDRERFIEWITSTPVRWPREQDEGETSPRSITVPATAWANLARSARANGPVQSWESRLTAYLAQMEPQAEAAHGRDNDDDPFMRRLRRSAAELQEFLERFAGALGYFGNANGLEWDSASAQLKSLMTTYHWAVAEELTEDLRRIDELVDSLGSLKEWGTGFSPEALRESIREGLQSQASDRGEPVGAGVYIGPPAGIAGTNYDVMYAVGMVERQFPPRPRANPWLAQNRPELDRGSSLERYDFMAAVAAAKEVVLSWPAATAERRSAYPSRWVIEAANHLHEWEGGTNRLTHENLTENASAKPWLTVVPSREAGLRNLSDYHMQPADVTEYNLMHLVAETRETLLHHPAIASDLRVTNALNARNARNGSVLSPWDGQLEPDISKVAAIGTRDYPISPSALETWATCPYKFFLNRILGIAAPPEEEEDEMSASARGSLVHKILERFVREGNQTDADLLDLAETEFAVAEERGVTGYPLLWDMAKEDIRAGLRSFMAAEAEWLAGGATEASAEESFGRGTEIGEVNVAIDDLGEIWFRGKIDRIDVVGDEVRVRDFKTGKPEPYFDGAGGRKADRTLANGRAMQLPVYVAAARKKYPDPAVQISGSYCFPLADNNTHGVAPYTEDDLKEFYTPLFAIVDAARRGVFPATPETAGDSDQEHGNCTYCDFNRLCPIRRRQVWERKAREDAATILPFNSLGGRAAIGADDNDN